MSESTARQLFELTFAFLTGAAMGTAQLPVYALRQIFPSLAALWDAVFYALAGVAVFAAGQWCSGGVRCAVLRSGNGSAEKSGGGEKKKSGRKREKKMKKIEKNIYAKSNLSFKIIRKFPRPS